MNIERQLIKDVSKIVHKINFIALMRYHCELDISANNMRLFYVVLSLAEHPVSEIKYI